MGIPGYFVDLLRRNRSVLILASEAGRVDIVCIDANGVIYEAVRAIEKQEEEEFKRLGYWPDRLSQMDPAAAAKRVAPAVVATLVRLPMLVGATQQLVVAFDGIAPNAKISQQRQRRFGRLMLEAAFAEVAASNATTGFNTTQITPDTPFMKALMPLIEMQLRQSATIPLLFSGSDQVGEGEHKLMDIVRSGVWKDKHVMVHGLDADLILLTLANQHYCASLRLAREAPSFVKHIDESLSPLATYVIEIPELAKAIGKSMGGGAELAVTDYVFLMSMLGNDFLPHQPGISIRDGGIERLCKAFGAIRAEDPGFRVMQMRDPSAAQPVWAPNWPEVQRILTELGEQEDKVMTAWTRKRRGMASRTSQPGLLPLAKRDELEAVWNSLPVAQPDIENWIDAGSEGWRNRYYEHFLNEMPDPTHGETPYSPWLERASEQWLQGLMWVWEYYTGPNPSWSWEYQGTHPPPLLQEIGRLGRFEPGDKLADWRGPSAAVSSAEQLARVLPQRAADAGAGESEWELPPVSLAWQYCRHAWEAELSV